MNCLYDKNRLSAEDIRELKRFVEEFEERAVAAWTGGENENLIFKYAVGILFYNGFLSGCSA